MISSILDISTSQLKKDYIKIQNLSQFKIDVPHLHPSNPKYLPTWIAIKKLIVEGMWGYEFDRYRFCDGALMYYANLAYIYDTDEAKNTIEIKPLIRDLEWELFYGLLEAEGFSGFSEDDKFTSDNLIFKYDKHRTKLTDTWRIFQSNGKFKEYIPPRENIRMLHDKPMGKALKYNEARNFSILGSRGKPLPSLQVIVR